MEAAQQLSSRQAPPLQIKKLYVLAALEVEAFRKKALSTAADAGRMGSDGSAHGSVLSGAKLAKGAAHTLAGGLLAAGQVLLLYVWAKVASLFVPACYSAHVQALTPLPPSSMQMSCNMAMMLPGCVV